VIHSESFTDSELLARVLLYSSHGFP